MFPAIKLQADTNLINSRPTICILCTMIYLLHQFLSPPSAASLTFCNWIHLPAVCVRLEFLTFNWQLFVVNVYSRIGGFLLTIQEQILLVSLFTWYGIGSLSWLSFLFQLQPVHVGVGGTARLLMSMKYDCVQAPIIAIEFGECNQGWIGEVYKKCAIRDLPIRFYSMASKEFLAFGLL